MLLSELTNGLVGVLNSVNKDPDIRRVVHDSREILAGDIFCCLKGESTDGHLYIHDAIEAGAVAILAEEEINEDVPTFTVENVRNILPKLSSRIVGNPSRDLKVVGVTGTNGKTSVVNLLSEILDKSGISTAVIGTLTGTLTTPEAPELQRILRNFRETGVEVVCMEVSSHSLVQKRVHETFFSSVAFTNLTHDHLDFHNTMKEYFDAKSLLFDSYFSKNAVIAKDQEYGRLYCEKAISQGMNVEAVSMEDRNVVFTLKNSSFDWRQERLNIPVGGPFAAFNAIIAAEIALQLGLEIPEIVSGLTDVSGINGRFEHIRISKDISAVIDYAHTPSALEELLKGCRKISEGRIILVFGCGGDRDPTKRPLMGEVASLGADLSIVTSDNPRMEDPEKIIDEILVGMKKGFPVIEIDRKSAIERSISEALPGDLIVIAGRGHEEYQEVKGEMLSFSDRDALRIATKNLFPPEEQ